MLKKKLPTPLPARKPRADAQRNRERILEVAKEVFSGDGAAAEQRFAAAMPPLEALRAWMLLFIDQVSEKRLIIPAMDTIAGGSMRLIEGARSLIRTAFVASVNRAIASGNLRSDTDSDDFVRALVGVFHTTARPGWEPSAAASSTCSSPVRAQRPITTHPAHGKNGDPERRRAAIDEIYTEGVVFYDPSKGVYRGRDEIDRIAGVLRATHPDFTYQLIAEPKEFDKLS
jgi:hypothetical protein